MLGASQKNQSRETAQPPANTATPVLRVCVVKDIGTNRAQD